MVQLNIAMHVRLPNMMNVWLNYVPTTYCHWPTGSNSIETAVTGSREEDRVGDESSEVRDADCVLQRDERERQWCTICHRERAERCAHHSLLPPITMLTDIIASQVEGGFQKFSENAAQPTLHAKRTRGSPDTYCYQVYIPCLSLHPFWVSKGATLFTTYQLLHYVNFEYVKLCWNSRSFNSALHI